MTWKLVIPRRVWSQNVRDKRHWHQRLLERRAWTTLIRWAARGIPEATGQRAVLIVSHRARLIDDDANLRGGAKECVDALVHAGMLIDDSNDLAYIRYEQARCKRAEERTEIFLSDEAWSTPHGSVNNSQEERTEKSKARTLADEG